MRPEAQEVDCSNVQFLRQQHGMEGPRGYCSRVGSALVLRDVNKEYYVPIMNLLATGFSILTQMLVKGADVSWLRCIGRAFFKSWQGHKASRLPYDLVTWAKYDNQPNSLLPGVRLLFSTARKGKRLKPPTR